jgi:hypothetical protein
MSSYRDYVEEMTAGTPGTGPITLSGTALSAPARTFRTAFGNGTWTVDVEHFNSAGVSLGVESELIYDGGTPGTLTRGNPETPGTLVDLPSGGWVKITRTAAAIERGDQQALLTAAVSGTSGAVTGVAGRDHLANMSGWTAHRDAQMPVGTVIGQRVAFSVGPGSNSFSWIPKTPAGQTCEFNGVTVPAATEITRIRITNERLEFEYCAVDKWRCIHDGRIGGVFNFSVPSYSVTGGAIQYPATWIVDSDNSGLYVNATFDHALIWRAGSWDLESSSLSHAGLAGTVYTGNIARNAATTPVNNRQSGRASSGAADRQSLCMVQIAVPLVVGDSITAGYQHSNAGAQTYAGVNFNGRERLR